MSRSAKPTKSRPARGSKARRAISDAGGALDEHRFSPTRARVKVGNFVRFMNNGAMIHTVVARDGSWSTPSMGSAEKYAITFDQPGTFLFHCQEHPWAIGEIVVEP